MPSSPLSETAWHKTGYNRGQQQIERRLGGELQREIADETEAARGFVSGTWQLDFQADLVCVYVVGDRGARRPYALLAEGKAAPASR